MRRTARWGFLRVLLVLVFGIVVVVVLWRRTAKGLAVQRPIGSPGPARVVDAVPRPVELPTGADGGVLGPPVDLAASDPELAPAAEPPASEVSAAAPEPGPGDASEAKEPAEESIVEVSGEPESVVSTGVMPVTNWQRAVRALPTAGAGVERRADLAVIRVWAREHGYTVADRGRIAAAVVAAYDQATTASPALAGVLPESGGVDRDAVGPGGVSDDGQHPSDGRDLGLPGGAAEPDPDHGGEARPS